MSSKPKSRDSVRGLVLAGFIAVGAQGAAAQEIAVSQPGDRTSRITVENFTGTVLNEPLLSVIEGERPGMSSVTFAPGARSYWHAHPVGQALVVTAGQGWVQMWDSPALSIRAGDVVWIPPGVKHWHGAARTSLLTHIAAQNAVDGGVVEWMEPVDDAQYAAAQME